MRKRAIINGLIGILLMLGMVSVSLAGGKELILRVDGLACPFCAYGLEKKMMEQDGFLSYDADLKKGEVYIGLKEDAEINVEFLHKAVKESGFTLREVFLKTEDGKKQVLDTSGGS